MVSNDVQRLVDKINELTKDTYWARVERNIGTLSILEQTKLKEATKIAVTGTGGIGAPVATQLVYLGCRNLVLLDHDKVEQSNLNRQLPFTEENIGKYKVDVLTSFLAKVDPGVNIKKYYEVNETNIETMLHGIDVIALCLDDPVASVLIARKARELDIPMVETYAVPYLAAWWFTQESIDYESCYNLQTHQKTIVELRNSKEFFLHYQRGRQQNLMQFPAIQKAFSREKGSVEAMLSSQIAPRSNALFVFMAACNLVIEIIFAGVLKLKSMTLAPQISGYDYLRMRLVP